MSPEQIFALIAALTAEPDPNAFATLKAGGANPDYPVTVSSCARPVPPTEIEGKTIVCGTVAVPFDHRTPDGPKINIAFNLYKAHSLTPAPDPVIYLHGGPGTGTVGNVAKTIGFFEHLRGRRDIIAIDERGVDASAPEMDCYSTLGAQLGPVVDSRIRGIDVPNLETDFVKSCLDELAAKGIDYSLINTEQNAIDVPSVMSALGYDSYNIYGVSYGTKLTMEILRQNPPGIRSAIIDGNAPPWLPLYSMFWQSHSAPIQLSLAPCERDPVCAAAYPDIVARTFKLFETLGANPIKGPNGEIGVPALLEVIDDRVNVTGKYNAATPYIPLMVTQLEKGDTTLMDQLRSGVLPPKPAASSAEAARAAALAAKLSEAEMAQVEAMLSAAAHMKIAEETVARAAALLEGDLDDDARSADLAEVFDDRLAAAMRAIPDPSARLAVGRDYLDLRFKEPSAPLLIKLIEAHMDPDTAADLSGLVAQLSPAEVARVFALIREDNEGTVKDVEGDLQLYLYACQEDYANGWNSSEKFAALMKQEGSWGPLMQEALVEMVSGFDKICPLFEKHPRENWTTVGSSDLPVLAMNGELDTQTAAVWGALAVQNYSHSQNVVVPESGHGTIRYSQCAKDITAAFIENPEGDLDTSCIKDLRLPVMMPDGTLHVLKP